GGEGSPLARALEPDPPGRRPGKKVALRIGDRDDRVVEGGLDVRDPVGDVALLLPLAALPILLLSFRHRLSPGSLLCGLLLGRLLLARHGAAARALAGSGIGLGPLAADRQPLAVTD